jgi:hypothetical protein
MPNFFAKVRAQEILEHREPSPATLPRGDQEVRDLYAPEAITPQSGLNDNYRSIYFAKHARPLATRSTFSFTDKYSYNVNFTELITSVMATRRNRFTLAPTGMMMDSGLSYALPVSKYFAPFASLQPSLIYAAASPQSMWAAGLQIPIVKQVDAGQDLSLKLSTSVDQQYRPIFFLSLNLMSFGGK